MFQQLIFRDMAFNYFVVFVIGSLWWSLPHSFFYLKRFTFVNCSWFVLYKNDCIEKKIKQVLLDFLTIFFKYSCVFAYFLFFLKFFVCFVFVCFFFACSCLFYYAFIVNYLSNNNKTTYRNLFCDPKSLTVEYTCLYKKNKLNN